jgi:hypothetical protein
MHRLILLSSTYQQSSRASDAVAARDPDNRLCGRMSRRRLDAEAIRDSLFAVAGRLDTRRGGPARADPGSIVGQRGQSVVAPQALFFLNDPLVGDLARALAARVAREAPAGTEARIRRLYALALGRPPTPAEIHLGAGLLARPGNADAWERYCHLLLCTNEFVYLD